MAVYNVSINEGMRLLQEKLLLPDDFFNRLLEEDDWSFVIKLHALIEAVCGSLLLYHLDEPGLQKIISRLELSNKTIGKIAFLKELKLLGEEYRRYISSLSEWRNNFVHNVQNCHADLTDIIASMNKEEIKKFTLDFSPAEVILQKLNKPKSNLLDAKTKERIDTNNLIKRAQLSPKFHIWLGAYDLLNSMIDMEGYSDYLREEKAMKFLYENEE